MLEIKEEIRSILFAIWIIIFIDYTALTYKFYIDPHTNILVAIISPIILCFMCYGPLLIYLKINEKIKRHKRTNN